MTEFALQFDIRDLGGYAARFPAHGDAAVLVIGRAAARRGFYELSEFRQVCRWKTPRSTPLVARNDAREVRTATRTALAHDSTERERIDALRRLHGVGWPTASVLLHVSDPDRWPILDVRALHALGVRRRVSYGYGFWEGYVEAFRRLVGRAGVDGRTVDRALWEWSWEQDHPSG